MYIEDAAAKVIGRRTTVKLNNGSMKTAEK